MSRLLAFVAAALVLVSSSAIAKERAGVQMPDTTTVEGKSLTLQGIGLRKKLMFKVYAAGLYVETPSKDAQAILSTDQTRRVILFMLRNVDKKAIGEAISEGFTKNSAADLPKLQERLNKFIAMLPDLKEKDQLVFTYVPGKGLTVSGATSGTLEGKDFADALFAVWLGKNPVDDGLKKQMLGAE